MDLSRVPSQSSRSNLEQAFGVAEQLGVARLLDPEGEFLHTFSPQIHQMLSRHFACHSEDTLIWMKYSYAAALISFNGYFVSNPTKAFL